MTDAERLDLWEERAALKAEVERLRAWGRQLAKVAVERSHGGRLAVCGEYVSESVCSEGEHHYHVCEKAAIQFELELDGSGRGSWVLRCAEHASTMDMRSPVPLDLEAKP